MSRYILLISTVILILMCWSFTRISHSQEIKLIKAGDIFPETPLKTPIHPKERKYLGLSKGNTFTLKEIKSDLVLVEIISVYCPSCQRQAPAYNELFDLIENDPDTRGRIKIIGIAAGNGDLEVKGFKEKYKVRFPIIPDPQFEMHRDIGSSLTPFSIYVRQDPSDQIGIVAETHLGPNRDYQRVFKKLGQLMTIDLAAVEKEFRKEGTESVIVKPVFSDSDLLEKVENIFTTFNGRIINYQRLVLKSSKYVYTVIVEHKGKSQRLFAEVISRPSACGDCHDIHFIYVFDASGKVLRFVPLQLTKYGNKHWDQADIAKMQEQLLGRSIAEPFIFQPEVDAVSSATITSAVIFDNLSQGKKLLAELKEKDLI
ncbi:MAG: redoxin domain-containing protein [Desulfobacterales bacterium]|nr:MAG: redoxin domain-containing protein [Desulfobacterales bacterium]